MQMKTVVLMAGVLLSGVVLAGGDPATGEKMVKEHACASCHQRLVGGDGSALYTRSDRKVTSKEKLAAQVSFCSTQLKTGWFPEDEEHVVAWLNHRYYHFK